MKDKIITGFFVAVLICGVVSLTYGIVGLVGMKVVEPTKQETGAPTTQQIVWMTNFSLVFSRDGKEIIYKPETEVGFGNDGAVFVRIKKH